MRYRLHDTVLDAVAETPACADWLRQALATFGLHAEADGAPSLHLALAATPDLRPPAGAERLAHDDAAVLFRTPTGYVLQTAHVQIELTPTARRAVVTVATADVSWDTAAIYAMDGVGRALIALLRYVGIFTLHAAGLVDPEGRGWLFAAPSGQGKSTLAWALVRQGWTYLSDDLLTLHPAEDPAEEGIETGIETGIVARALTQTFGLYPHAQAHFPEIAGPHTPRPDVPGFKPKWNIDPASLFPGQARAWMRPSVLVLPHIADVPHSRLAPVDPATAFVSLSSQLNVMPHLETEVADAQWNVCRQLVQQCRLFRLDAGHDLRDAPERITSFCTEALALP